MVYNPSYLTPNSLYVSPPNPYIGPPHTRWFVLCICESAPFLWYFLVCCIFYIPHISDITQYLSFSVWLISLSIMPSKSIHVAANGKMSFFFYDWVVFHCMYVYTHIFYLGWTLRLLPYLGNYNVSMNIGMFVQFWIGAFAFFSQIYIYPGMDLLGHILANF